MVFSDTKPQSIFKHLCRNRLAGCINHKWYIDKSVKMSQTEYTHCSLPSQHTQKFKEKSPTPKKNYQLQRKITYTQNHTSPHHKKHHQHTNTTKQHHDTQQNKTSWSLMKSRKVLSTWRQWQTAGCVRTCWDNICALRQGTGASEKHLVSALNLPSCYGYISTCQMKDQKEDGKYICYGL